ncbi:hypothetical protein [Massilia sp. NR 4-1]
MATDRGETHFVLRGEEDIHRSAAMRCWFRTGTASAS